MMTLNEQDQTVVGCDIVDLLRVRNEQLRHAFANVMTAEGRAKAATFDELVSILAVREAVAQELVRALGDPQVRAPVRTGPMEPTTVVSGLALVSSMDVEDDTFDVLLSGVARKVALHIEAQERDDLPLLRRSLPVEELHALAEVLLSAESAAAAWRRPPRAAKIPPAQQSVAAPAGSLR